MPISFVCGAAGGKGHEKTPSVSGGASLILRATSESAHAKTLEPRLDPGLSALREMRDANGFHMVTLGVASPYVNRGRAIAEIRLSVDPESRRGYTSP